ncbi:MAG: FAD-dependent thymidylate synthase [Desulfurivibrionaceae bacterium]|nr:FAD-dependent thymidylate synthase [Desulfobulbales bacterium]MDT8334195.1 FAD-dependent thymidylate synthase [Desulfurivibrionaceae bacterium]
MKVIPASFEIQDDLDRQSLAVRIEACGRICYKSEDKIDEESAGPFIEKILKHGHNSVAEMGVVTLKVEFDSEKLAWQFYGCQPRFIQIDRPNRNELLITGSVRAYRELYRENSSIKLIKGITAFLAGRYPLFFSDIVARRGLLPQTGVDVEKLSLDEVEKLPVDLLVKHRYVGVKFYTNRAVTHEIVRHRPCSFLQESQRYCRYSEDKFGSEVTFIKPMFFAEDSAEYKLWAKAMEDTEKIYLKLLESSTPQAARTVLPNSCKTEIIVYANLLEWRHIFRLRISPAAEPSMREVMIPLLKEMAVRFPAVFEDLEA